MSPAGDGSAETTVEFYAGHRGDETPRAVVAAGRRIGISRVLARERVLDRATGASRDVWRCRLEDGRTVTIEIFADGARRVSGLD